MRPQDTYVNPLLTNVYLGYGGDQHFVAGELFPTVFVDKETGTYFVRDKENLRAPADARRGMFSRANAVSNKLTPQTYTLEEKTLEHAIPERIMKNYSDPFDPKKNGIMLVTDKLKLDKEIDLQTTILAAASGSNTVDAGTTWSTISTDIVGMIRTGRNAIQKATGKKANTAMISKVSLDLMMKNTAFLDSIKYSGAVNEEALRNAIAAWFDIPRIIIGDAINNTAKEGQTDVNDYIWTDNVVLAYVNPNPVVEDTTAGLELKQADLAYADEWYEQWRKCQLVRVTDFYDNKVVDSQAMYIITNTSA